MDFSDNSSGIAIVGIISVKINFDFRIVCAAGYFSAIFEKSCNTTGAGIACIRFFRDCYRAVVGAVGYNSIVCLPCNTTIVGIV